MGVHNSLDIKVLDLDKGEVTNTIPNPSKDGYYYCFQSFIGKPNLVLGKDRKALILIDTTTLTATKLVDSIYESGWTNKNSMV